MKTKVTTVVTGNREIAPGVYDLRLQYHENEAPDVVLPGQFVGVYSNDGARLLPRPISICGWDAQKRELRIVFRVVGKGTCEFSKLAAGDTVSVLGILGNGYDTEAMSGKRVLLMGGGIGAPPMLGLAKALQAEGKAASIVSVLGYRTDDLFLKDEFDACGQVLVATDDGSAGFHGNVVDAVKDYLKENTDAGFDVICSCGPLPMLRGVKALAKELGAACYISLEERMACGVGACLGCVTKTKHVDAHSHVKNARICTEGPVFDAEEVEI